MAAIEGRMDWLKAQAWLTAYWSRVRRLPPFEKAVSKREPMSIDQAREDFEELSKRAEQHGV